MKLLTYVHTIKYLKLSQLYHRIAKKLATPKVVFCEGEHRQLVGEWTTYRFYSQKIFDGDEVEFLNKRGSIDTPEQWNSSFKEKLWLYNLHYFDDLSSISAPNRKDMQISLMKRWTEENPAPIGNGWEPYPLSLRIVNWIKGVLTHIEPNKELLNSLASQTESLANNIEFHILGNHLFANAKALVFSGVFFSGKNAESWLNTGINILEKELDEQILIDGGHFELSPMYHAIILMDVLDLVNVMRLYDDGNGRVSSLLTALEDKASKMLHWLEVMSHPDGQVSMFNDSAFGISATFEQTREYARLLKIPHSEMGMQSHHCLESSGYSRISFPNHITLFDHARVGPDYLPGHAHADSLSIEWSVGAQRVLVNSGTSLYGSSPERIKQRKTFNHNSVVVNGEDSSEVWSGFRVARRAYCDLLHAEANEQSVTLKACHNGYMRLEGKVKHYRTLNANAFNLAISDELSGNFESAKAMFHLHPEIEVTLLDENNAMLTLPNNDKISVVSNGKVSVENCNWYPEFGVSLPNQKLSIDVPNSQLHTIFTLKSS